MTSYIKNKIEYLKDREKDILERIVKREVSANDIINFGVELNTIKIQLEELTTLEQKLYILCKIGFHKWYKGDEKGGVFCENECYKCGKVKNVSL